MQVLPAPLRCPTAPLPCCYSRAEGIDPPPQLRQSMLALSALLVGAAAYSPTVGVGGHSRAPTTVRMAPVAMATAAPPRLYTGAELPKVAGGVKVGTRRVVVVTGASSGLGLSATKALIDQGDHFVVAAVRNPDKMDAVASELGLSKNDYVAMKLELASLQSVKDFVKNLRLFLPARPISHLIGNAAVYKPADPEPSWTDDGFEMSLGVNHLGHFLLVQLLLSKTLALTLT